MLLLSGYAPSIIPFRICNFLRYFCVRLYGRMVRAGYHVAYRFTYRAYRIASLNYLIESRFLITSQSGALFAVSRVP